MLHQDACMALNADVQRVAIGMERLVVSSSVMLQEEELMESADVLLESGMQNSETAQQDVWAQERRLVVFVDVVKVTGTVDLALVHVLLQEKWFKVTASVHLVNNGMERLVPHHAHLLVQCTEECASAKLDFGMEELAQRLAVNLLV